MSSAATAIKERPILFSGSMVNAILEGRKTQTRRVLKTQPPKWIDKYERSASDLHWLPSGVFLSDPSGVLGRGSVSVRMNESPIRCPYGTVGDRLWVRETWRERGSAQREDGKVGVGSTFYSDLLYRADGHEYDGPWRPSIFMPRKASRINLEVTDTTVERLRDISEADAIAEGMIQVGNRWSSDEGQPVSVSALRAFEDGWHALNAKRGFGWDTNPWVWMIEFRKL